MENIDYKDKWRIHYDNWQKIWRDPKIPVFTKVVLYDVYLYRSDQNGWYISERKLSHDLGIGKETASKALDDCVTRGFIHMSTTIPRKRRKLYLAGFLQAPAWTTTRSNNWHATEPSKYQKKYLKTIPFKRDNSETDNALSPDSLHDHIKNSEAYKRILDKVSIA